MTRRRPWGAGEPPPWHCTLCGRRIGRDAVHYVVPDRFVVLCVQCQSRPSTHRIVHPDCPVEWHDMTHGVILASRGGAWLALQRHYEDRAG